MVTGFGSIACEGLSDAGFLEAAHVALCREGLALQHVPDAGVLGLQRWDTTANQYVNVPPDHVIVASEHYLITAPPAPLVRELSGG